jgi:RHH-type transcriptional regulator, rel operon repressor / antitoxin RelB
MKASTTLTVRLTPQLKLRLDRLAKATKRSKSFLTMNAIESFVELNEWQLQAIQDGIKSADAGHLIEHKQVEAWVSTWGTKHETEPPR